MSNETERTLHELKLPGMASCWSSLEETHQLDKLTLREGMQKSVQRGERKVKAVLISIKPKWCDLIRRGRKTVEIRRTTLIK